MAGLSVQVNNLKLISKSTTFVLNFNIIPLEKFVFDSEKLRQRAASEKKQYLLLIKKLKKLGTTELDERIHSLHEKYEEEIDCLDCGNCCKSISPAMKDRDIERIAKYLKVKPSELVADHMEIDDDGDYVFRSRPCPFIGEDNYCSVYPARPKACREYPHTDRNRQHQILNTSRKNIAVCPIVYSIFKELREM